MTCKVLLLAWCERFFVERKTERERAREGECVGVGVGVWGLFCLIGVARREYK